MTEVDARERLEFHSVSVVIVVINCHCLKLDSVNYIYCMCGLKKAAAFQGWKPQQQLRQH